MSAEPASPAPRLSPRRATGRRRLFLAGLIVAGLLLFDWSRAPARQATTALELAAIRRYQVWISPWLQRGGVRCRFTPSCSHYAAGALARDGFVIGNLRSAGRLLRCGPWTDAGTVDPP